MKKNLSLLLVMIFMSITYISGCDSDQEVEGFIKIEGLEYDYSMEIDYAENFTVDYYKGGYALISICDNTKYLVCPENLEIPTGLEGITIIKQPVENLYLVSSAVMSLFVELDVLDEMKFTGTKADDWYIDEAREAVESGELIFAGKYSQPDYELILSNNCNLAIENTMIEHTPEVKEKLQELGINVMVEQSSYESHPLGRTEWIKLFSVLYDLEEEAEEYFDIQKESMEKLYELESTNQTVAFFYVNTTGSIVARASNDYVPKMIDIAGGRYIYENLGDENSLRSTVTIGMEEFYATALDADILIYNGTIDKSVGSIDELIEKDSLFSEFKAVQNGNVWGTTENLYQSSNEVAPITEELNIILNSDNPESLELEFFYILK